MASREGKKGGGYEAWGWGEGGRRGVAIKRSQLKW